MTKVDIENAYRTVGLHPDDRKLTCFKWEFDGVMRYCEDKRATMGHAASPAFFCRLSQAVRAILAAEGCEAAVVFVDDFFQLEQKESQSQEARERLSELLKSLNFTEKLAKREGPTQDIVFLGLRYETNVGGAGEMRITVPEDKMRKAEEVATDLQSRETVTLKQLQSAVGYFNHVASAIFSARAFIRRLIHAIKAAEASGQRTIPVTRAMKLDFQWWERFAREFNGTAVVLAEPVMKQGFFSTDASDLGMGGFLDGATFAVAWDDLRKASKNIPLPFQKFNKDKLWPKRHEPGTWAIHYRELFAMWWPLLLWTEPLQLANKHLTIHCDNAVARCDLNNMSAPNALMMRLIRHMMSFAAKHNMRLIIVAISSEANILADALSRLDKKTYEKAKAEWLELKKTGRGGREPAYTRRVFRNPGVLEHEAAAAGLPPFVVMRK